MRSVYKTARMVLLLAVLTIVTSHNSQISRCYYHLSLKHNIDIHVNKAIRTPINRPMIKAVKKIRAWWIKIKLRNEENRNLYSSQNVI